MIVLDTNVLSELMRPQPAEAVLRWLDAQASTALFTTTITQAEILFGLRLLPEGKRRAALLEAAEQMFKEDFAGRILPFDTWAAQTFAGIAVDQRRLGRVSGNFDTQIAAIAKSRGMAVATRNTADFQSCELMLIDPWED